MKQLDMSVDLLVKLSLVLVWMLGLGSVESCTSSRSFGDYRVVKKTDTDTDRVVVSLEEDTRLFCQTNAPWKKCVWRPPRSGVKQLHCLFTRDSKNKKICPSFPEVHYDQVSNYKNERGVHICAIVINNVQEFHEGNWRCEFELEMSTKDDPAFVWDTVRLDARGIRYP